jgi:hypothetical protein
VTLDFQILRRLSLSFFLWAFAGLNQPALNVNQLTFYLVAASIDTSRSPMGTSHSLIDRPSHSLIIAGVAQNGTGRQGSTTILSD